MIKIRLKNILIILSLITAIGAIGVGYISYAIVKRFIFRRIHKQTWLAQTTQVKNLLCKEYGAQPVFFPSSNNVMLAGLLFIRPEAKRTWLMCHGYSRSKERLHNLIKLFPTDNILIFDYRAHGESQGDYTTIGYYEKDDVNAAFNFLTNHEHAKKSPIYGIGVSMGAVSLLGSAASGTPFKGIIVDSAFKSLDLQIAKMFPEKTGLPMMPFMNLCQTIFEYVCNCSMSDVNACEWAQKLTIPVFIIHSNHDALADVAAAHELYSIVTSPKKLWIVDNAHHAGIFKKYPEDYVQQITTFIDSI